jgi:hypothetical protein
MCVRVSDHEDLGFSLMATGGVTSGIWTSLDKLLCTKVSHFGQAIQDGCPRSLALVSSHMISYGGGGLI